MGLWTGSITTPRQIFQQSNFIFLKSLLQTSLFLFLPLTQDIHRTVVSLFASSSSRHYFTGHRADRPARCVINNGNNNNRLIIIIVIIVIVLKTATVIAVSLIRNYNDKC